MSGALLYSILNRIFGLLKSAVDVEDTVVIESRVIDIDYTDVKAGRLYSLFLEELPDRCCLLHSQLNVKTPFATSSNPVQYAQFHLGVAEQEKEENRAKTSKYSLIYNGVGLNTVGLKSPNGTLIGKKKSKIINFGKNNLVAYFSLLGGWSIATSVNQARNSHTGTGEPSNAIIVGGLTAPPYTSIVSCEVYNGSVWVIGGTPPRGIVKGGSTGANSSSAIIFAGQDSSFNYSLDTSSYNGYSWTNNIATFPIEVYDFAYTGTASNALSATGNKKSVGATIETFRFASTTWSVGPDTNLARVGASACGTSSSSILTGGNGISHNVVEEFNGISWSISTNLNSEKRHHICSGKPSAALVSNGVDSLGNYSNYTEEYDGLVWITSSPPIKKKYRNARAGTSVSIGCIDITGLSENTLNSESVEIYTKSNLQSLTSGELTLFLTYCYT